MQRSDRGPLPLLEKARNKVTREAPFHAILVHLIAAEDIDGCWKLKGAISVNVDEDDNDLDADDCILDVPFEMFQLDGANCNGAL